MNKRHYEHTLPNIRGSLSNTYEQYGVTQITSEVSLTARTFFEKKGYEVVKAQKYRTNKLELTNFVMRKILNYEQSI